MSEDATSQPSDPTNDASATEDDDNHAQQLLVDAVEPAGDPQTADDTTDAAAAAKPAKAEKSDEDKLGDSGKRALTSERKARREAERQLTELSNRLKHFEDRDKTELQKAVERAEASERDLTTIRTANARLMAAATYNIPPDLIELLGSGTDEEIDARAKLLAERFAAATPPAAPEPESRPAPRRPVESLTPGAKPASAEPEDMDAVIRRMAGRGS